MVGGVDFFNYTEFTHTLFSNLPSSLTGSFSFFLTILKALGIALLIYILFQIISAFLNWRKGHRLKMAALGVEEINKKMDNLKAILEKLDEISDKLDNLAVKEKAKKSKK